MGFESVEIFVFATDEHDSLIETVHSILSSCNIKDIGRILIIHPEKTPEACLSAISELKSEYPDIIDSERQIHPYLGGAIKDSKNFVTSSHVILFPADLAIDLTSVPGMIEGAKKYPDEIVKTSRWLTPDGFRNYPKIRKFFNRLAQAFLRVLYQRNLTDFTNPVQIMPSEIFKSFDLREERAAVMLELVLVPVKTGVKIREIVPTVGYGREEGKSKNSFLQTFLYLNTAFRVRFFTKNEK